MNHDFSGNIDKPRPSPVRKVVTNPNPTHSAPPGGPTENKPQPIKPLTERENEQIEYFQRAYEKVEQWRIKCGFPPMNAQDNNMQN